MFKGWCRKKLQYFVQFFQGLLSLPQIVILFSQQTNQLKKQQTQLEETLLQINDYIKPLHACSDEEKNALDAFYVSFEDKFRGSSAVIKERMRAYLPIIKTAGIGSDQMSILDIGCGRGEWLALLKEHNLHARGVDSNLLMIKQCQSLNLEVIEADGITYLSSLPSNSLGALTAIHIIEHIPFRQLIKLFDEALRVLKPGGMIIFETPNPENLIVGACNFYYDPTHLKPLPPPMLQYLAEARGFINVSVQGMNASNNNPFTHDADGDNPDTEKAMHDLRAIKHILQSNYFAAPDYALLAYKHNGESSHEK